MTKAEALDILATKPRNKHELALYKAALEEASAITPPSQTINHDSDDQTPEIPIAHTSSKGWWSWFKFW